MRTWGRGMLAMCEAGGAGVDPPHKSFMARNAPERWGRAGAADTGLEVSTKFAVVPKRNKPGRFQPTPVRPTAALPFPPWNGVPMPTVVRNAGKILPSLISDNLILRGVLG